MRVDSETFERLVAEAVDALPTWVHERMDNVAILVALRPTSQQRNASRIGPAQMLLGLYEGVPLTARGRGYHLTPPDRITLFQLALEAVAHDEQDLVRLIRETVIHEVAHHLGFSEEELRRLKKDR